VDEEPQPDASWLRLVDRDAWLRGVETWHYEGPVDARLASSIDSAVGYYDLGWAVAGYGRIDGVW